MKQKQMGKQSQHRHRASSAKNISYLRDFRKKNVVRSV